MKLLIYILLFIPGYVSSQSLIEASRTSYKGESGGEVILYAAHDCEHCYYYLPTDLRISLKANSTPEVSLVTWKNDSESDIIGGVFHLLVTWGLTAEREKTVKEFLHAKHDSLAVVMGPSVLTPLGGLIIKGDDKLADILRRSLSSVPLTPTTPGSKAAFSFRFTENEIQSFLYYVKNPGKTTTQLEAVFTYEVMSVLGLTQTRRATINLPFKEILQLVKNTK